MRGAHRNSFINQILHECCRIKKPLLQSRIDGFHLQHRSTRDPRSNFETCSDRVKRIKKCQFIFLQITIVSQRQAFEENEYLLDITDDACRLSANQLQNVRISFLGHDRGTGRICIR